MSSFTTPLLVTPMPDGKHWKLLESFVYEVGSLNSGTFITVVGGFITDFASTPGIIWGLFPPWGKYGKAAVLHDWMYIMGLGNRARSDSIFLEAMLACGTPGWKARIIYSSVRTFGWIVWNRYRKNERKGVADVD